MFDHWHSMELHVNKFRFSNINTNIKFHDINLACFLRVLEMVCVEILNYDNMHLF